MNPSFGPFLVILGGLALGASLRKTRHFPVGAPKTLNAYVIAVAVPALVLARLPTYLRNLAGGAPIEPSLAFLPAVPWLMFGGAIAFFGWCHRRGWLRRDQYGLLVLSGGLGNTAFVGFPLLEALLGPESIPPAILLDQLGTFLVLSVGGTLWISYFQASATRFAWRRFLRDLLRFPPFVALVAAALVAAFGGLPPLGQGVADAFAATLVPVAMISVGTQLGVDRSTLRRETRALAIGLGYKMALFPLLVGILGATALGMRGELYSVAVLESAMAPMITSTVLGIEAGLAPSLGALMLGVGIPLSLATVPLIHFLIR